jgi:hypothetical protein
MKQSWWLSVLVLLVAAIALFVTVPGVIALAPQGANVTEFGNQTSPVQSPQSQQAIAGNVSEINLDALTTTQAWQGYYGNVTGTIVLADNSNYQMYNWSVASPRGQVYASTNSSIPWATVQCFNFTATGADSAVGEVAGDTNQKGMNLTQLQAIFNISTRDDDSIDKTFNRTGAGAHTNFYTANLQFNSSECQTTSVYDSTGTNVTGHFEEVIQYEPTTNSVIWTSLLNEDLLGFDQRTHDFEMLVPENGHGTDTSTTTYYFYLEIQ